MHKSMIKKANENLQKLFGPRHDKPITAQCIEAVYTRQVLSIESDSKTTKGSKKGYLTGVLYLAPAKISGINTCPAASKGCEAACLFTAGRGVMYPVFRARVVKTLALFLDRHRFFDTIQASINKLKTKAKNKSMVPIVRLNGTSDLAFEKFSDIIQNNSDLQFYDYTKRENRLFSSKKPKNLDLTFSLAENNHKTAQDVLQKGGRVAAVFREIVPKKYWDIKTVDGDSTDLRFLDPANCIVGLKAKGRAKKDTSGFVL